MSLKVPLTTYLARLRRAGVSAPEPLSFNNDWKESTFESEFVKGITTSHIKYSGRPDYVGLVVVCKMEKPGLTRRVHVIRRDDRRLILFVENNTNVGALIVRVLTLDYREKVGDKSAIIFNFLKGEPLCNALRKLLPRYSSARSQAAVVLPPPRRRVKTF